MSIYELNYQLHKKMRRRALSEQNTFDPVVSTHKHRDGQVVA